MKLRFPYWYLLVTPIVLFGFGFLMNVVVMAINGGQMPVRWLGPCPTGPDGPFADDPIHACMTHATHLKFLADWIWNGALGGIESPGDLFETLSDWMSSWAPIMWAVLMIKKVGIDS